MLVSARCQSARQCPDFFSFFGFGGSSVCDGVKDLISNGKAVDL
jgi:hypothetical protein